MLQEPNVAESPAHADGRPAPCFDCAYDLRGQPSDGRCPECGLAVAETVERFDRMAREADPPRLRRTAWWALGTAIAAAAYLGTIFLLAALTTAVGWLVEDDGQTLLYLVLAVTLATSVAATVCVAMAARSANRVVAVAGGANRRVLGVVGWAFPLLLGTVWVMVALEGWLGMIESPLILENALAIALWLAAGLFPLTLAGELRRVTLLWPRARMLPIVIRLTWLALTIGFTILTTAILGYAVADMLQSEYSNGGYTFYARPYWAELLEYVGYAGFLIFAGGCLALAGVLIAVLVAARRLQREGGFPAPPFTA